MKPDIEHIATFIKVVESGSFTAAAELCNLSKPVISKHITALEVALNTRLLERSTRKLSVTEAGKAFYEEVRRIPELVSAGENAIQPYNQHAKGELKLLIPATFANSMRAELLPTFIKKYSDVTLDIELLPTIPDFVEGDYDIIIMGHLSCTPMPDVNWVAVKLCDVPIGVFATTQYLKKHGTPKTPDDLKNHNCLSSLKDSWPFVSKDGFIFHVPITGTLKTTDDEIVHAATIQHLGIAYSVPYLFIKQLKEKKVVPLLAEYTNIYIEVYALYRPNPYLPMKIKAFLEETKQYYNAMQEQILKRRNY